MAMAQRSGEGCGSLADLNGVDVFCGRIFRQTTAQLIWIKRVATAVIRYVMGCVFKDQA